MYEGNPRYVWAHEGTVRPEGSEQRAELAALLDESDPAYSWIASTLLIFSASGIPLSREAVEMAIKVGTYQRLREHEVEAGRGTKADQDDGVVYYVRRGSMIKIGTTVNMYQRMQAILPDEILVTEPGSYSLEAQRHREFLDFRVHGQAEWFHASPALQAHIHALRALYGEPDPTLPVLRSS